MFAITIKVSAFIDINVELFSSFFHIEIKENGSQFPHFDGPQFPVSIVIITQLCEIINFNGKVSGSKQSSGYIIPPSFLLLKNNLK